MDDDDTEEEMLIGGRYRVERRLGRGGMGRVVAATDVRYGERVAVKVLHPALTSVQRTVERLRREARILHDLNHPGIVQLLDCGPTDDGSAFVTMELLEGETLQGRLRRDGAVPWREMARVVICLCDALGTAHEQGVVHRDVKPSNIFLTRDREHPAKVIDFGIAVAGGLERMTLTGEIVGTPAWMAPEQLRGSKDVDRRTDVYAIGLVAWAAVAGRIPFKGERDVMIGAILQGNVPHLCDEVPEVPRAFGDPIMRAMSVDRRERQLDARDLAIDIAASIGVELRRLQPRPLRWSLQDADTVPDPATKLEEDAPTIPEAAPPVALRSEAPAAPAEVEERPRSTLTTAALLLGLAIVFGTGGWLVTLALAPDDPNGPGTPAVGTSEPATATAIPRTALDASAPVDVGPAPADTGATEVSDAADITDASSRVIRTTHRRRPPSPRSPHGNELVIPDVFR